MLCFVALCQFSCGEEDGVRIQLTEEQREAYQNLALERIDSLRPLLDSICDATFEDRVAIATDSIVQLRLEEEARLRTRIGQMQAQ